MQTAYNTLEQMLHQSKKNIYPHQQRAVKKKTFLYHQYKLPPKPVNTIDPSKFRSTAPNQHKSSIRPKPTPETRGGKKQGKIKGPGTITATDCTRIAMVTTRTNQPERIYSVQKARVRRARDGLPGSAGASAAARSPNRRNSRRRGRTRRRRTRSPACAGT